MAIQPIDVGATECNMNCTKNLQPVCATLKGNTDPALYKQFNNTCELDRENCGKNDCKLSIRRCPVKIFQVSSQTESIDSILRYLCLTQTNLNNFA